MKSVQRQKFSFTKTSIEGKVSLKIMKSGKHKLVNFVKKPGRFMFYAGFLVFGIFFKMNSSQENHSELSFYSQNRN